MAYTSETLIENYCAVRHPSCFVGLYRWILICYPVGCGWPRSGGRITDGGHSFCHQPYFHHALRCFDPFRPKSDPLFCFARQQGSARNTIDIARSTDLSAVGDSSFVERPCPGSLYQHNILNDLHNKYWRTFQHRRSCSCSSRWFYWKQGGDPRNTIVDWWFFNQMKSFI